jgi:hypothetical protein
LSVRHARRKSGSLQILKSIHDFSGLIHIGEPRCNLRTVPAFEMTPAAS